MEVFRDYAGYYNAFYGDKNYREEAQTIDRLLKTFGSNIRSVINMGCGTGRHDIELAKLGYLCHGVDLSETMIDIARENAEGIIAADSFETGDMRNYRSGRKYDAVVSLFHVMSYQNTNEDVCSALMSVRGLLNEGGIFVFDFWYGPGVLSDRPEVRVKEVTDRDKRMIRIARPVMYDKTNVVDVNYEVYVIDKADTVQIIRETHSMRYFFRPELEMFLGRAGFEIVRHLDCRTLRETDFGSWTSYVVARAIGKKY